jgi:hypothetical protein
MATMRDVPIVRGKRQDGLAVINNDHVSADVV